MTIADISRTISIYSTLTLDQMRTVNHIKNMNKKSIEMKLLEMYLEDTYTKRS